jgi:aminopeptidase
VIDPEAFARLLSDWCLELREGQQVMVVSTTLAEPLIAALHEAVLARGAWPLLRLTPPELEERFYTDVTEAQLDSFPPLELTEVESADAWLRVRAPANTRALVGVDPARIARAARARAPIAETRLQKRWCGTIWPTAALAQEAGMSERDYEGFVERALFLDRPDPVAAWRDLGEQQEVLVHRLDRAREIRIEADGTDLRLRVDGRHWINSDGKSNMPSGEVFTGPLEDSATGTIRFTVPTASPAVDVEGVELSFSDGEVVAARADRGEEYLRTALATDPGARRLGELGIGTNAGIDRPTGSTLLDEKIAGTVHLALGRSYPETGGRNTSALHWDLICDLRGGGRLTADGEVVDLIGLPAPNRHRTRVQ